MNKQIITILTGIILTLHLTAAAKDNIRIVTTLTDFAALAQTLGGDKVTVEALVRGNQDPHHIEVLPSYMMKLRKADLFLIAGMDLDIWAFSLRDGSRNANLRLVDCSQNIKALEVPQSQVNASQGDIHIHGNPHYWLDPENSRLIMATLFDAFVQVSPENESIFMENRQKYLQALDQKMAAWQGMMQPYKGTKVIFYHNSWPYFSQRFGLEAADFIEPKPGIAPSPAHTARLIALIKDQNIKILALEPFFSARTPTMIAQATNAAVMVLASSVGGVPEATDYFSLFEYNLTKIITLLSR